MRAPLRRHCGDDGKVHRVTPAQGVALQALHLGVRGLRLDPDAVDGLETGQSDPRRERLTDVADAFRPREGGVGAVELRQRGVA